MYGGQGGYGVQCKVYIELNPLEQTNLMGCCLGMAKCLQQEDDLKMVMLSPLSLGARKSTLCSDLPTTWHGGLVVPETVLPNMSCDRLENLDIRHTRNDLCQICGTLPCLGDFGVFRKLGHSSDAALIYEAHHTPALKSLLALWLAIKLMRYRHPDPQAMLDAAVTVPSLQLRGSWLRLQISSNSMHGANSKTIPSLPRLQNATTLLFTGRPTIDVFDLKTERWSSFHTIYTPTPADLAAGVLNNWPYAGIVSFDSATQVIGDKLYVFGGGHGTTVMGCNLFMELDLLARKWRRLSGTVHVTEHGDYTCPRPRKNAASWVGPDKAHFYLLFGVVDRDEDEVWIQERLAGNPPCTRTEMACGYQTIVFGGYCPNLQAFLQQENGQEGLFPYSYVADTFIYDLTPSPSPSLFTPTRTAPKWKQVLTLGFPTYRCQAHLACDHDTGRTYMFSGWTNSQYIPIRSKLVAKTFGDLWELRLDEPHARYDIRPIALSHYYSRCRTKSQADKWLFLRPRKRKKSTENRRDTLHKFFPALYEKIIFVAVHEYCTDVATVEVIQA
ncbi:hypothetical protein C8R45DRAFT_1073229 [Mycena sanguinolenta]|nr:hypothetical protein C8R45DRAFT_1073229 [Mycena sanguinolenta]